jgi:uncharacterized protein involved in type VI secretion and phage assembly
VRLQEQQTGLSVLYGVSECRAFGTGYIFTMQDHYRSDLNQAYILTAIRHRAQHGLEFRSGGHDDGEAE